MLFKTPLKYLGAGGVFLFIDRFLKWQATEGMWRQPSLLSKFFGWDPFLNPGIAFGIPVPRFLVFVLTIFIIVAVLYFYYLNEKAGDNSKQEVSLLGLALILSGAISNLFDRLFFGFTIDYIRIFNGVINFADIFIVLGFVLYFSAMKKT